MARALSIIDDDRDRAIQMLERCHARGVTDGSMADYFFPALRTVGLMEQHDVWFEESWAYYMKVLERFPGSHNTRNTAAWTAARANRKLDEAEALVTAALEDLPNQAAYLDTFGEIWFCRGNREKALEWSDKALLHEPGESTLVRQHVRFREGEFPLK
jgi:tetratricopeptide (TPR) repeat protein